VKQHLGEDRSSLFGLDFHERAASAVAEFEGAFRQLAGIGTPEERARLSIVAGSLLIIIARMLIELE
jgi:hypothetical protein